MKNTLHPLAALALMISACASQPGTPAQSAAPEPLFVAGQWLPQEGMQAMKARTFPAGFDYTFARTRFRTYTNGDRKHITADFPDIRTELQPCPGGWCSNGQLVLAFKVEGKDTVAEYQHAGGQPFDKQGTYTIHRGPNQEHIEQSAIEDETDIWAESYFRGDWEITRAADRFEFYNYLNPMGEFRQYPGWHWYRYSSAHTKPLLTINRNDSIFHYEFRPRPQATATFELWEIEPRDEEELAGMGATITPTKLAYTFKQAD